MKTYIDFLRKLQGLGIVDPQVKINLDPLDGTAVSVKVTGKARWDHSLVLTANRTVPFEVARYDFSDGLEAKAVFDEISKEMASAIERFSPKVHDELRVYFSKQCRHCAHTNTYTVERGS